MQTNEVKAIASLVEYLREPFQSSKTSNVEIATTKPKQKRLTKKARDPESYPSSVEPEEVTQKLPKGRIRYGPITVNPRKEPSKTLFTGRRSKNEVLSPDEEERRRDRRERNRVAATKCREKREIVLHALDEQCQEEESKQEELNQLIKELEKRKHDLEIELNQHSDECFAFPNLINQYQTPTDSMMIFGDPSFLSSMPESQILPIPLNNAILSYSEEDEQSTTPIDHQLLTNSAYSNGDSNSQWQTQEDMIIAFTTSSLERLMISIRSPTQSMDINNNNNNNNSSSLVNSNSTATCAKQSGLNEDESVAPTIINRFIC